MTLEEIWAKLFHTLRERGESPETDALVAEMDRLDPDGIQLLETIIAKTNEGRFNVSIQSEGSGTSP